MTGLARRWIDALDRHRLLRPWIVPIVFVGVVLFSLFLRWTPRPSAEMAAVFLAISLAVALFAMGVQVLLETYVQRKRRS